MLTARNEFETIEAWTTIAGCSLGTQSHRATTVELLKAVDLVTNADTRLLWVDLAECSDDNIEFMFDIQRDAAELLTEHAPLPDYCTVDLCENEWMVLPYMIEGDLPRLSDTPDDYQGDNVLVVNDHGNVSCMRWVDAYAEPGCGRYIEQWSMV